MPSQKVVTGSGLGHFISFEGDRTAISEQLRLLPSSPDILIFPALLDAIRQPADNATFSAHSFVRHVHEVVSDRVDLARSFLQSSSRLQPRLVLANGGCLTAQSLCLSMISDKFTNGDVGKAERLFLDIVNDGVAGLTGKQEEGKGSNLSVQDASRELMLEEQQVLTSMVIDNSTAVHIKTTNQWNCGDIQSYPPNEDDIELGGSTDSSTSAGSTTTRTTPTPSRRPTTAFLDQDCELAAKRVEDWQNFVDGDRSTDIFGFRSCSHKSSISTFADAMTYLESTEELENFMLSPPWQEKSTSPPLTPKYPDSNRSVCNISPTGSDVSDLIPSPLSLKRSSSAHYLGGQKVTAANNRMGLDHRGTRFLSSTDYVQSSSQVPILCRRGRPLLTLKPQALSEHGIIVRDSVASKAEIISSPHRNEKRTLQPFEPVFAIAEDLVILFPGGVRNGIFEYVVDSYKNGRYPIGSLSCPLDDSSRISALGFQSPSDIGISISQILQSPARSNSNRNHKCHGKILNIDGMDHFVSCESTLPASRVHLDVVRSLSGAKLGTLTPTSKVQDTNKKIYEVEPSDKDSAVDVQNCLRALLNIPPFIQSKNPQQTRPVLAYGVLSRLTKEFDECQGTIGVPINRMLALGCEDSVDQHFYRKISRRIEKLWCDTALGNGIHVLDVRDPIINAMEAFTSQSLSIQAGGNPFSQPPLLADLIVPHLESYRSTMNPRDLLVLQYPESYFSTIIALRELLGSDALQVAGIVDVTVTPRLESSRESTYQVVSSKTRTSTSLSDRVSCSSVYSRTSSNRTPRASAFVKMSFSKADFILPNTATESEISTFLSNIHNNLTKVYSFYAPHTSYAPYAPYAPSHASSSSPTSMSSTSSHPPYTPPSFKRTFFSPRTESLIKVNSPSFLNCIWSEEAAREKELREKQLDQGWENFYLDESDDEDEDELERIFTPRSPVLNRASSNSNKALKWLGLT